MVIDLKAVPVRTGSGYPAPFNLCAGARQKQALGDAGGLTQFGVNLTRLPPRAWSAQRHWHHGEDEFVWVLEGELVLITDAGEQTVRAGQACAFKCGVPNGHHFVNRSGADAVYLEVGTRTPGDICEYPDVDLHAVGDEYVHKDGTPY
ncbi:cupin domain-containing protein [Caulobacter sp. 17J80-11]|uniref:cupin domain-containing protein n=1 Tax=Caulobacter sp. 17J80-11 TaxID=2763502 RepID=UPI00165346BD|nr:cupin domain-containing protein [Caulobacter sp. 17J80-11]MBC6981675.1 cupin domain-containing protein [Caulobacter sp. 17J80-11]